MTLSNKEKLKYYQNKELGEKVILGDAKQDKHVIYGARAINKQLPSFLQSHTEDFDIFSKTPKADAYEAEKKLDKAFGGDFFKVAKAKYPNTWKVKSNVTGKTAVDYTYPGKQKVPSKNLGGNRYAKLSWMKKQIKRNLNNPKSSYRFEKDNEALQRIEIYEKNKEFLYG